MRFPHVGGHSQMSSTRYHEPATLRDIGDAEKRFRDCKQDEISILESRSHVKSHRLYIFRAWREIRNDT